MDFNNPKAMEIFFELYNELPRGGPGSRETTLRAFHSCSDLPILPKIADLGCGPGPQTIDLALGTHASITAIDNHDVFIERLIQRAKKEKVSHRINAFIGDMGNLPCEPHSLDAIWCEGAAYFLGLKEAITYWRRFLKPGGYIALSHAVRLVDTFSPIVEQYWDSEYGTLNTIEEVLTMVKEQNYHVINQFLIPPSDWIVEFYGPLVKRANILIKEYEGNQFAQKVLTGCRDEAIIYQENHQEFGYLFIVMQAQD